MPTKLDWPKLVRQNRAKAVGISWTPEEMDAIHKLKMNPEDVRSGFLSPEELEKSKENRTEGEVVLEELGKDVLIENAEKLG